jgi:vancomycin resistance protein YoaR
MSNQTSTGQANPKNSPSTNAKAPKKRSFWLKFSVIFVLALVTLLSPGGWAIAYKNRVYPNVVVAGINVGGLTQEEAKIALDQKIEELKTKGPTLSYDSNVLNPSLEELGVSFDSTSAAQVAYDYGRKQSLRQKITSYYNIIAKKASVDVPLNVDQEKLTAYVDNLSTQLTKEATNAGVKVTDGQVEVIPPADGVGIDGQILLEKINTYINDENASDTITLEVTKIAPKIQTESTTTAVDLTNKYLSTGSVTLTYQDRKWVADRKEIGRWMKYSVIGNEIAVAVDPSVFISAVAKQVEIPTRPRQIQNGTGQILDEGQDGLGVDSKVLSAQIKTTVQNQRSASFEIPVYDIAREQKTVYPDAMPGRYEGRYIDVNLTQQRLYAFEGFTQVNTFLVSTGTSSHRTPTGEYHVYGKSRVTTMDGPGYSLPGVEWVSWWSGDYSIHGTYWHHNFGHPMSHGCVNASNADAEWIYNWDSIGTPVYIHY